MPRRLYNPLRRIFPPYGFAREQWVAQQAASSLKVLVLFHNQKLKFNFKAVPVSSEADALLGFLSAAADVMSQAYGGKRGGHGSVNATLFVLQALLLESDVVPMLERTMSLHAEPTASFLSGHQAGGDFVNADLDDDLGDSIKAILGFCYRHYATYCSGLDGKP